MYAEKNCRLFGFDEGKAKDEDISAYSIIWGTVLSENMFQLFSTAVKPGRKHGLWQGTKWFFAVVE